MKILPINTTVFKGFEVDYPTLEYGESGLRNLPGYHKHSTVEDATKSHHTNVRNKVYFASPKEFVHDSTKDRVDFVVYDNEPSYPKLADVKRNYLENNRTDYRKEFEEVREYYYRMEMGGFANINEAKYQQWQAAKCTGLYDKAGDLRYKKETAEDAVNSLTNEKSQILEGINNTKAELKTQTELGKDIEKHLSNLRRMQEPVAALSNVAEEGAALENKLYGNAAQKVLKAANHAEYLEELENTDYFNSGMEAYPYNGPKYNVYENTTRTFDLIDSTNGDAFKIAAKKEAYKKQANLLQRTISDFERILGENAITINDMKNYINDLKAKAKSVDEQIAERKSFIEDCKAKLKPLFEELSNFYKSRGIKVIKK